MTRWTPQRLHFSEAMFSIYLLVKQQLDKVTPNQFFFGMHFAIIAIVKKPKERTNYGKY